MKKLLLIRWLNKTGGHPEPAPRGRRRGGVQSKDPAECKTDARTTVLLSRDASTPFRPRLRPRRNSAQHDLDLKSETSQTPLPGKLTGNQPSEKKFLPQRRTVAWQGMVLFAICATGMSACRPSRSNAVTSPEPRRGTAEGDLREQLNPVHQPSSPRATAFVAPPPWNPAKIFPVPVRPWLPLAEVPEKPAILPDEKRIATSALHALQEFPLHAPITSPAGFLLLPVAALARANSPDPARLTVWIATGPAPEARSRPPNWDRPQLSTDPTARESRDFALSSPSGLRETPLPFLRLNIPDPFEQIAIAELRNPPPENDPPVTPFTRPAVTLPESPGAPAGK